MSRTDEPMPGLRRILAPNPSPMTAEGTNSYLLGDGRVALIDPGPEDPAHLRAILAALRPGERISHILVTHAHRDHSGLAAAASRATGAPVLAFGDAQAGRSALMNDLARRAPPPGGEGVHADFRPDEMLADGSEIDGGSWHLRVLHTPGHFGNHICLAWGDQVFSGDHIMGWSTSIVAPPDGDMGAYMRSLDRLAAAQSACLWPGHGAPITAPGARIADLIRHRRARAAAILAHLHAHPASAHEIAQAIYSGTPPSLMAAASLNVFAHLIELAEENLASPESGLHFAARFHSR